MYNGIPSKSEVSSANQDAQRRQQAERTAASVSYFESEITAAMRRGESSYSSQLEFPDDDAQEELKKRFAAAGWTLRIYSARSGGEISWS